MKLRHALVVGLVAVLCLSNAPPAARAVQAEYGQITFENKTDFVDGVDLKCYVDGEYVGTALKGGLFITVEATAGSHTVKVIAVEDSETPRETEDVVNVEEGGTTTWTITED